MDIGVMTAPFRGHELEDVFATLSGLGVDAVELGTKPDRLLPLSVYHGDSTAQASLLDLVDDYDLRISALLASDNPLHPDESRAERADDWLRRTVELADALGVGTVICFSGLPGGGPSDEVPNWVTAPWPTEHTEALAYQWDEVAVPYWREVADHAEAHGIDLAVEMHPNMLVYEPTGLVRLREATNDRLGANFDPSHLYWQGIDVTEAIRYLGERDAIHHVHAKDTRVYEANARLKGVLDTLPYTEEADRSWLFRTVGYGHAADHWRDVVSTLRLVGYDDVLSIEHEDSLTSPREGLEKAVSFLRDAVFETEPGDAYWAE